MRFFGFWILNARYCSFKLRALYKEKCQDTHISEVFLFLDCEAGVKNQDKLIAALWLIFFSNVYFSYLSLGLNIPSRSTLAT